MTENRKLANEIREWLLRHDMWVDTTIYFDGVAYSTSDKHHFYYNDREHLIELKDQDPKEYFEYVNPDHILSMSFEGPLYDVLNGYCDGWIKLENEFRNIFRKYGLYFELGNAWNLSCFKM